jgi:DNA-binding NtrC family response regulator
MKNRSSILFTHDVKDLALRLESKLEGEAYPMVVLDKSHDLLEQIEAFDCGAIVTSTAHSMVADASVVKRLTERQQEAEVIVVSPHEDVSTAVRLMKAGVHDVLVQPVDSSHLLKAIQSALSMSEEKRSRKRTEERNRALTAFDEIVGDSPAIQLVRQTIGTVAPSDANVLISGESGTGKELVAKALHARSKRASKPFIAVNCAALPKDILENELFGHEKGAFTGALNLKLGCFELADNGTLFLDEISEMTVETQAKLLRAIEEQTFRRLGGRNEIKVDVRVIAATNRGISNALAQGNLRSDLYYRLSVVEIGLPPLRDRKEDIVSLANHFLKMYCYKYDKNIKGFTIEYMDMLQSYRWPGNIRELRNAVERAVVICPGEYISILDLPEKILKTQAEIMHISIPIGSSVEEAEKKLILETLASVGNNKAKAARILGVSRKTLHNKLHSFDWRLEGK